MSAMEDEALLQKICEHAKKLGKPIEYLSTADIMAATGVGYHTARKIRALLKLWRCSE